MFIRLKVNFDQSKEHECEVGLPELWLFYLLHLFSCFCCDLLLNLGKKPEKSSNCDRSCEFQHVFKARAFVSTLVIVISISHEQVTGQVVYYM